MQTHISSFSLYTGQNMTLISSNEIKMTVKKQKLKMNISGLTLYKHEFVRNLHKRLPVYFKTVCLNDSDCKCRLGKNGRRVSVFRTTSKYYNRCITET